MVVAVAVVAAVAAVLVDEAVDEALKDFVARKKASMEDAWY